MAAGLAITGFGAVQAASYPGAPVSGIAGTGAGVMEKGSMLTDTTNGKVYTNTGTKLSPTWTVAGTQT